MFTQNTIIIMGASYRKMAVLVSGSIGRKLSTGFGSKGILDKVNSLCKGREMHEENLKPGLQASRAFVTC